MNESITKNTKIAVLPTRLNKKGLITLSVPYYVTKSQQCEFCEATIYIGHECVKTEDGYFCNEDCTKAHLYLMHNPKEIYLTNDKIYREVD